MSLYCVTCFDLNYSEFFRIKSKLNLYEKNIFFIYNFLFDNISLF